MTDTTSNAAWYAVRWRPQYSNPASQTHWMIPAESPEEARGKFAEYARKNPTRVPPLYFVESIWRCEDTNTYTPPNSSTTGRQSAMPEVPPTNGPAILYVDGNLVVRLDDGDIAQASVRENSRTLVIICALLSESRKTVAAAQLGLRRDGSGR